MKTIISSLLLVLLSSFAKAQVPAFNFTVPDCNGNMHTLFDELDSGKVVIIIWVMPCDLCTPGAKTVIKTIQNFNTTYPGRVIGYMTDDFGDNDCNALRQWMDTSGIDTNFYTLINNAGTVVDQTKYGSLGMPRVLVAGGGTGHKVYYNVEASGASDLAAITNAVNWALIPAAIEDKTVTNKITLVPNPAINQLKINSSKLITAISIISSTGQVVKHEQYIKAGREDVINLTDIPVGLYTLKVYDKDGGQTSLKFTKE